MTIELVWQRRPSGVDGQPMAYYAAGSTLDWAIFPELGGKGWDLCAAAADEGYDLLAQFPTVAEAKRAAQRRADREARA